MRIFVFFVVSTTDDVDNVLTDLMKLTGLFMIDYGSLIEEGRG